MKNVYLNAADREDNPCVSVFAAQKNYTVEGHQINIPAKLLAGAGISPENGLSVLSSDGVLIIVAASRGYQRDLTDELGCFLEELGYDPETVETVEPVIPF
jgi:hypothetical protein